MTHLFSNFSKVILLKVLSPNFHYSLHWAEYRIHLVELTHSTWLFFLFFNSKEKQEGERSTNWIVSAHGLKHDLLNPKQQQEYKTQISEWNLKHLYTSSPTSPSLVCTFQNCWFEVTDECGHCKVFFKQQNSHRYEKFQTKAYLIRI